MPESKDFVLTRENYHSVEANNLFMSNSLYKDFLECEAKTMASLKGQWLEEPSEALLVGQYVHSFSDGSTPEFIANHPGMFTQKGGLRSEYKQADKMIETLKNDPLIMFTLEGQKEVIMTAEFAGATWKVMLDVYNPEKRRIVDIKTTRNIREYAWNDELKAKVNFIENYNYMRQMALYAEIERLASGRPEGDWFSFYIAAVSKQDYPDKEIICMDDTEDVPRFSQELEEVKRNMPRILAVKSGEIEPERCERCNYCRSTRMLKNAIHWTEL